jgi:hypothetical protein
MYLTVSDVARRLGSIDGRVVRPRDISDLFYSRALDDMRCPIANRGRLIPEDYLPTVRKALREKLASKAVPA